MSELVTDWPNVQCCWVWNFNSLILFGLGRTVKYRFRKSLEIIWCRVLRQSCFTKRKSNLGIYTLDGNQQHKLSKAKKRRRRRKVYILSSALDDCRFPQSSAIRETWWHLICITMVKGRNFCPTKSRTRSWLNHFDFQSVVHLFSC